MDDAIAENSSGREFEIRMKRLEEIVNTLESGELTLEEGMALYREGALCSKFCREKLQKARQEVEIWREGEAVPFNNAHQGE